MFQSFPLMGWSKNHVCFVSRLMQVQKNKISGGVVRQSARVRWGEPLGSERCCDLQCWGWGKTRIHETALLLLDVNHTPSRIFDAWLDYLGNAFPLLLTVTFPVAQPAVLYQATFMRVCDDTHGLAPALCLSQQQHGLEFTPHPPRLPRREQRRF